MNALQALFDSFRPYPWTERLALMLMHSIWEDTLIAALMAAVLIATRRPTVRHACGCIALALMVVLPILTPGGARPAPVTVVAAPTAQAMHSPAGVAVAAAGAPIASTPVQIISRPWFTWIVAVWLAGVGALSLRNLVGWARVRRLVWLSAQPPEAWRQSLLKLSRKIRVSQHVQLRVSARLHVPAVIGWLHPVILFPAAAVCGLTPEIFEAILLHELAHLRRRDYLLNLLQIAVETFLFYHPAIWWVSRRVRQERENCCDDMAADGCNSRLQYARALAAIAEVPTVSGHLALGVKGGSLLARIERLVGRDVPARSDWRTPALASLLAMITCLLLLTIPPRLLAQNRPLLAIMQPDAAPASTAAGIEPADLVQDQTDYHIEANDLLSVSIFDLMGEGTGENVRMLTVSSTGKIAAPFIPEVKAAGLTAAELAKAISAAYKAAGQIASARVSVTITEARGNSFTIMGDIRNTGQYAIPSPSMRLLDALAVGGGVNGELQSVLVIRNDANPQNSGKSTERRLQIPGPKLMSGDSEVNVFIRPHDVLIVKSAPSGGGAPGIMVHITIGEDSIRLEGKEITMDDLPAALEKLPDHPNTVIALAPISSDLKVGRYFDAKNQIAVLVQKYGFRYLEVP